MAGSELGDSSAPSCGANGFNDIQRHVLAAVQLAQPARGLRERRRSRRYPYPYPIHLTPHADDGAATLEQTLVVIGKHLSEGGLDFYCNHPLPCRHATASFPFPDGRWVGILVDLSWCRFTQFGWYEHGGKFLRVTDSPLLTDNGSQSISARIQQSTF